MFTKTPIAKWLILAILLCSLQTTALTQCPGRAIILEELNDLKTHSQISPDDKLKRLLKYNEQVNDCVSIDDSLRSVILRRIGVTYFELSEFSKAILYTQDAIKAAQRIRNKFPRLALDCFYNLQIYYDSLKQKSAQIQAIDSCIAIDFASNSDYYNSCILIGKKVKFFYDKGDYELCIRTANIGETLIRRYYHYIDSFEQRIYLLNYKVDAFVSIKEFSEAEKTLFDIIQECKIAKNVKYLGSLYGALALVNRYKGTYNKAIDYFIKAYRLNLKVNYRKGCAETLAYLGLLYLEQLHQPWKALSYNRMALRYSDSADSILVCTNIADIYTELKDFDSAFYFFQKAFNAIEPGITEVSLYQKLFQQNENSKKAEYVTRLVIDKGDTFLEFFKYTSKRAALKKAISVYREADRLVNKFNSEQIDRQSKLFWRSHTLRLYENAVQACYLMQDTVAAFYFFEKSRAVLLSDQLNERKWMGEEDILRLTELEKKLLKYRQQLEGSAKNSTSYITFQKEIYTTESQLEIVQNTIKKNNPLYYQSFVDSGFITIGDMRRKVLGNGKALIEIFSGDSTVYLLALTSQKIFFRQIDKIHFDTLAAAFSRYLAIPDLLNRDFASFTLIANKLYRLLFDGLYISEDRIIISPGDRYFPFESLVTNTKPVTYYVDDHAVSYTYSARYLLTDNPEKTNTTKEFLGVAPVHFSSLPSLTGSDQSLRNLQKNFNHSTSFIGNYASRNSFLREFYKYKIIQLYTHATESGTRGEPMIYFADSALSLSELLPQEKPVSDLIVLSACETASGQVYGGEGVFSFNRSFAALGIPSTVSNLWQTNDQATYRLTEFFYKYVAEGMPLDLAMQKAKKDLLHGGESSEFQLPYYWASSILVGKTDAIIVQKSFGLKWIVFLLLAAILFIVGWKIRNK